jgi:hypothetical protein
MKRTLSIAMLALSLGAIASSPRTAHAEAPSAGAQAQKVVEIYQDANRLYDAGQLAEAEARYEQAWAIRQSYDIASNLGALELDLHRPARAAELLTFAVQQFPANGSEKTHSALQARLDKARSLSCTLHLKVDEPGADIHVDGAFVGRSPLATELFVNPGRRTIAVSLGKRRDQQAISAKEGVEMTLAFKLPQGEAPAAAPPMPPSPAPAAVPVVAPRSKAPGFAAGAAGLLGLGIGGALIGIAESNRGDAQALHDSIAATPGGCSARTADCTTLRSTTAHADQLGNAGIGVVVTGSVLVTAGVAYLLWPTAKPAAGNDEAKGGKHARVPSTIRASVGASPQGGGVTVMGSF